MRPTWRLVCAVVLLSLIAAASAAQSGLRFVSLRDDGVESDIYVDGRLVAERLAPDTATGYSYVPAGDLYVEVLDAGEVLAQRPDVVSRTAAISLSVEAGGYLTIVLKPIWRPHAALELHTDPVGTAGVVTGPDGEEWAGITPWATQLPPGSYRLLVAHEDYEPFEMDLELEAEMTEVVEIELAASEEGEPEEASHRQRSRHLAVRLETAIDEPALPAAGRSLVRLVHLHPGRATVDWFLSPSTLAPHAAELEPIADQEPTARDIDIGDWTAHIPLPAGAYDLRVQDPQTNEIVFAETGLDFVPGLVYTVFLIGHEEAELVVAVSAVVDTR